MIVNKTDDIEAVKRIINHPKVRYAMIDDLTPKEYDPPADGFYIMDENECGVVRVDPINGITCIVHIACLPEMWGQSVEFTMAAIDFGFNHTLYTKITAAIPVFNRLAIALCYQCGFEKEGVLKESFRKNWKEHDMVLLGLTKTEFLRGI